MGGGSELVDTRTSNQIKFEKIVDWFLFSRDTSNRNVLYYISHQDDGGLEQTSWSHKTKADFIKDFNEAISILQTCYVLTPKDFTSSITRIPDVEMNHEVFYYAFTHNVILANRFTDQLGYYNYTSGNNFDKTIPGDLNFNTNYKDKTLQSIIGGTANIIDHMNASRWDTEPKAYLGDPEVPFFEFSEEYRV